MILDSSTSYETIYTEIHKDFYGKLFKCKMTEYANSLLEKYASGLGEIFSDVCMHLPAFLRISKGIEPRRSEYQTTKTIRITNIASIDEVVRCRVLLEYIL